MIGQYIDLGNPVSDHPLNSPLYGWWLGLPGYAQGSQWRDISRGNHGTRTNAIWAHGPTGFPCMRLDGSGDYITTSARSWHDLTDNFTLFVGYRGADTAGKFISTASTGYQLDLNGSSLRINRQGSTVLLSTSVSGYLNSVPVWFAATKTGTSYALYANGIQIATGTHASGVSATGAALTFGTEAAGAGDNLSGDLLEVRIQRWLSASGVAELTRQARLGHPETLRRFSRKAYLFGTSGSANAYTLTAAAAAFTFSGVAATLKADRKITAETGSYILSGQAAGLYHGYPMVAGAGAFTFTGQAAGLRATRTVPASAGAFTLTGQAASLKAARTVPASAGAFTLTGQDASLKWGRVVSAGVGSFTLTGQAATLNKGRTMAANTATFTLTGQAATFPRTYRLTAAVGAFTFTGNAASLTYVATSSLPVHNDAVRVWYVMNDAVTILRTENDAVIVNRIENDAVSID